MDLTTIYLLAYGLFLLIGGYFLPGISNRSLARGIAWLIAIVTVFYSAAITDFSHGGHRFAAIAIDETHCSSRELR
jgi:hypothetical protein